MGKKNTPIWTIGILPVKLILWELFSLRIPRRYSILQKLPAEKRIWLRKWKTWKRSILHPHCDGMHLLQAIYSIKADASDEQSAPLSLLYFRKVPDWIIFLAIPPCTLQLLTGIWFSASHLFVMFGAVLLTVFIICLSPWIVYWHFNIFTWIYLFNIVYLRE